MYYHFGRSPLCNSICNLPMFIGEVVWGYSTERFLRLNTTTEKDSQSRLKRWFLKKHDIAGVVLYIYNIQSLHYNLHMLRMLMWFLRQHCNLHSCWLVCWACVFKRLKIHTSGFIETTYTPAPWHSRHLPVHQLQRVAWRACESAGKGIHCLLKHMGHECMTWVNSPALSGWEPPKWLHFKLNISFNFHWHAGVAWNAAAIVPL